MNSGDPKCAEECANKSADIVESHLMSAELEQNKQAVDTAELSLSKKQATGSALQTTKEIKKVPIHSEDSSKMAQVATDLEEK